MLLSFIVTLLFVLIVFFICFFAFQPKYFARLLRISQTCSSNIPIGIKSYDAHNCKIYILNENKAKRIIFLPGGAFIRCCADFSPFTESTLRGYEIVMIVYKTLMDYSTISPVIDNVAKCIFDLYSEKSKPTLTIGYSAGAYIALKAIESLDIDITFLGINGWYNYTEDYLLRFYSWLYLAGLPRKSKNLKIYTIASENDTLRNSTLQFNRFFGILRREIPEANHFSFYDLLKIEEYADQINEIFDESQNRNGSTT